jgi:DNA-directed RNA polymerase specialized sigma24 family protein
VAVIVYDAEAPSSKLAIAELKKPTVSARLLKIAHWHTDSDAVAEDLVEDALVRVLDPEDSPWDPTVRTFLTHMSFVIRRLWYREQRTLLAQREVLDANVTRHENAVSEEPYPDDEVDRRRSMAVLRELGDRALALIADDPLARRVFELGATQGLYEPQELAEAIPCTPEEAKAALQRLIYFARKVLGEWTMAEDHRMKALRERARTWEKEGSTP